MWGNRALHKKSLCCLQRVLERTLPRSGYVTKPRVAALRGYPGKELIRVLNPERVAFPMR